MDLTRAAGDALGFYVRSLVGLAPSGPDVLFGDDRVIKLFGILRSIEDRARVS